MSGTAIPISACVGNEGIVLELASWFRGTAGMKFVAERLLNWAPLGRLLLGAAWLTLRAYGLPAAALCPGPRVRGTSSFVASDSWLGFTAIGIVCRDRLAGVFIAAYPSSSSSISASASASRSLPASSVEATEVVTGTEEGCDTAVVWAALGWLGVAVVPRLRPLGACCRVGTGL